MYSSIKIMQIFKRMLIAVLIVYPLNTSAKVISGTPFSYYYSPEDYGAHSQNFVISQDSRDVMYFGNFIGLLEFDGFNWSTIEVGRLGQVNGLAVDSEGTIRVGGYNEFGYIGIDSTGSSTFFSIVDKIQPQDRDFGPILSVFAVHDTVYYIAQQHVFIENKSGLNTKLMNDPITGAFYTGDKILLQFGTGELAFLHGDKIESIIRNDLFSGTVQVKAAITLKNGTARIFTDIGGLFDIDSNTISPVTIEADTDLKQGNITSAVVLPDSTIAIGTMKKGIIIIDQSGKVIRHLGRRNGLMSEYVQTLSVDRSGIVWCALNNGIMKLDLMSPLTYFDERLGLEGVVTSLQYHDDTCWVATYNGLFFIDKKDGECKLATGKSTSSCWSLLSSNGWLLFSTSNGVYARKSGNTQRPGNVASLSLHPSRLQKDLVYSSTSIGVERMFWDGRKWSSKGMLAGVNEEVIDVVEEDNGTLWLSTPSKGLLRLDHDKEHFERLGKAQGLPFEAGNRLFYLSNGVRVTTINGIMEYNEKTGLLEQSLNFKECKPENGLPLHDVLTFNDGRLLANTIDGTNISFCIPDSDKFKLDQQPFMMISRFPVWVMHSQPDGVIWLGGARGLVRYDPNVINRSKEAFAALIRKVTIDGDSVIYNGGKLSGIESWTVSKDFNSLKIKSRKNTIRFDFSAPSYDIDWSSKATIQFQYRLLGFDYVWSDWTNSTQKEYSNLPAHDYEFQVRAKSLGGIISSTDNRSFSVVSPIYFSWWAILLYVAFVMILLYAVLRMRSRKLEYEKHLLEVRIDERTREIVSQKEEIEKQSEELESKNTELEKVNIILKSINSEIRFTDLLRSILGEMKAIRGVETASALVYDKTSDDYLFEVTLGHGLQTTSGLRLKLKQIEKLYLRDADEVYDGIFVNNNCAVREVGDDLKDLNRFRSVVVLAVNVDQKMDGFIILENFTSENSFKDRGISLVKHLREHIISAFIKSRILEDLQRTFQELKDAQTRLIQSEKLASLGQLTAGIAHEIQNPLNFVNNFAVLTMDLIDEMDEYFEKEKDSISTDSAENIKDLLKMIRDNSAKINEHGKGLKVSLKVCFNIRGESPVSYK
jgi:hypothetical protein